MGLEKRKTEDVQREKRKRDQAIGREVSGKRGKSPEDDDGVMKPPADEEVDQFFEIMKRIQVAVKYFQKKRHRGGSDSTAATPWNPSFLREDFDLNNINAGLDLNSHPAADPV